MPSIQIHNQFEQSIHEWLQNEGFETFQLTYHEHLPSHLVRILQNRWSPTALYLRGRADRIAVHKIFPFEFEWEAKTHESRKYHDITLEALPLVHHIRKSEEGVKCLYIHHDRFEQRTVGFWVHHLPAVRSVCIPDRWPIDGDQYRYYMDTLRRHFPNHLIRYTHWNPAVGGGDPFVIIDEKVADNLPHWESVIQDEIKELAGPGVGRAYDLAEGDKPAYEP